MKLSNSAYLWIAMVIFASASAVTRRISMLGNNHLVDGRNPISLCNVLFVGNLCAFFLTFLFLSREPFSWAELKSSLKRRGREMFGVAVLSGALAPALIFAALDRTTVINVVLMGRLEPLFTLVLAAKVGGSPVHPLNGFGSGIVLVGVGATAFLSGMGNLTFGIGELQVAIASLCLAVAGFISKHTLQDVSLHFFNAIRELIGAVVFFCVAIYLYGWHHFIDVSAPVLWQWMLVYSVIIVVLGQTCWAKGLRRSTPGKVNVVNSCTPIVSIVMAFLILGEVPTFAQYVGCVVVGLGTWLSFLGTKRTLVTSPLIEMEVRLGYKGI